MHITVTASMPWTPTAKNTRSGKTSAKLIRESEVVPGIEHYTRLVKYERGEDVFTAPRHRHNFDQLRVALRGEQDFGRGLVSRPGSVAFFPEGAFYGPERIEDAEVLVLQWSDRWVSKAKNDAAIDELRKRGSFDGGIYSSVSADGTTRRRDSITAVWEEVFGEELVVPRPRYGELMLMEPDAFPWVPVGNGLAEKLLGRFTERDLVIGMVRWLDEVDLVLPDDRTQLVFTTSGVVHIDGEPYPAQTAIWSDLGERSLVAGSAGAEALVIAFPSRHVASFLSGPV